MNRSTKFLLSLLVAISLVLAFQLGREFERTPSRAVILEVSIEAE